MKVDTETIRRLEQHGIEGFEAFLTVDPAAGGRVDSVADARVFRWPAIPIVLFNHVAGLGNEQRPDEETIDRIVELYREDGTEFMVTLSPLADLNFIGAMLRERGFKAEPSWEVLALTEETAKPARLSEPVTIELVNDSILDDFIDVGMKAFGMPDLMTKTMRGLFDATGIDCFLGRYDGEPAGVGMVITRGGVAGLWTGGVREEFRRRGLHAALISARTRHALEQGANLVFSETEVVGGQSTRDLQRQGFFTAYEVVNWVFKPGDQP